MSLHLQFADTTTVQIYAELAMCWLYRLPCTMVTVGPQECQTLEAKLYSVANGTDISFHRTYF